MSVGQSISRTIKLFGFLSFLVIIGYFVVTNYSWVFAKTFEGQILAVEKVGQVQVAIIENKDAGSLFSYAVKMLVKRADGTEEIVTGSSEDRQWAVTRAGECVKARFQPYPPWNLEKGGTYFNVRLESFVRPCHPSYSGNAAAVEAQKEVGVSSQGAPPINVEPARPPSPENLKPEERPENTGKLKQ